MKNADYRLNIGRCKVCGGITTNGVCNVCGWCVVCCVCGKVRQIDGTWMKVHTEPNRPLQRSHTFCPFHHQIEILKVRFWPILRLFRWMMP